MTRGVRKSLVGSVVLVALIGVAGCSHYLLAEREPWRREAEVNCLNSGAVKEGPSRVRISAINGPGMCGMDYPLRVSALGESSPLGYTDDPVRPPGMVSDAAVPQRWPVIQSNALPPPQSDPPQDPPAAYDPRPPYVPPAIPQYGSQQTGQPQPGSPEAVPPQYGQPPYARAQYGQPQYGPPQAGAPMSLRPPELPPEEDELDVPGGPPHPYYGAPPPAESPPTYTPRFGAEQSGPPANEPLPPLGPPAAPIATGPVGVSPAATLACPIVSELDRWISQAVQPAALRWFRQPVVEIKQISAYSCRGMNGNPNAHISEHAFGNALDIAEFDLADGHKVSVQYGWHGAPEEQGFLRDVQAAACAEFTTVLAPGANVYHYNHIHVDLMRHAGGRHICEPAATPGEIVAARARAHYAEQHGDPHVTGTIKPRQFRPLGYSGEDDDRLPLAIPGDD
jgi:hypothetical protein